MRRLLGVFALISMVFAVGLFPPSAKSAGGPFNGELNICAKVENGVNSGNSVQEAILNLFVFYSDQPADIVQSIYEAIVFNSIRACHLDGSDVVGASLRFDLNLAVLVSGMKKAGLDDSTIKAVLAEAGINALNVQRAVSQASFSGGGMPVDFTGIIPPPYEISRGLGPASAFIP